MPTAKLTLKTIYAMNPCSEAQDWMEANRKRGIRWMWQHCERADWMLWLFHHMGIDKRLRMQIACTIVRRTPLHDGRIVWDLLTDERSRRAIEVAESWIAGKVTDEELRTAIAAADAAVYAAADAADAAVYAAADAAVYAAVYAVYAVYAAVYAAYADADADAAVYAAADAADAAQQNARKFQTEIIREIVPDIQFLYQSIQINRRQIMPATPLYVIRALAEVDASGLAENMLDRDSVEMLVTDQRAAEWLNSVSDGQYEDALEDMLAAGSDDWMRQDTLDSEDDEE